jgi:hypothetical protein
MYFDGTRAAYFQAKHLRYALESGLVDRVALAAAQDAPALAILGYREGSRRMAALAAHLAPETDDPYVAAMAVFAAGLSAFQSGEWERGYRGLDRAEAMFRRDAPGAHGDFGTCMVVSVWCLGFMGELREVNRRVTAGLRECRSRNDELMWIGFCTGMPGLAWIVRDEPDEARRLIDGASSELDPHVYRAPHAYTVIARSHVDLYEGLGARAHARLVAEWPLLDAGFLFRSELLRIILFSLRGRAALAAATEQRPARARRDALVAEADRFARRLLRDPAPWAAGLGLQLNAGVLELRGQPEAAIRHLQRAADALDASGMALYAAACRHRVGRLTGGDVGAALVRAAHERAAREGVLRADGVLAVYDRR